MKPEDDDILAQLRSADPMDPRSLDDGATSEEARSLYNRIVATPADSGRTMGRNRRWLLVPSAATIAVVALAVVLVGRFLGDPDPAGYVQLRKLAAVAAHQAPPTDSGGFRYTHSKDAYMSSFVSSDGTYTFIQPKDREIWIAPDGSGRLREHVGDARFLGPQDEQDWRDAGSPELSENETTDDRYEAEGLYYEPFEGLPDDVDELYEEIERRSEDSGPGLHPEMFTVVGDLLRETMAPPELRANLFRVLDRIPGVSIRDDAEDELGRPGTAAFIEYGNGGVDFHDELIFDSDTSELLGERQILLNEVDWVDAEPGTTIGYAVYLESGMVDSATERP
jgi:hypothetical protein